MSDLGTDFPYFILSKKLLPLGFSGYAWGSDVVFIANVVETG